VVFEPVGEAPVERARTDQIFDFKVPGIELSNRERDTGQTAGRNNGGDAAAVRQPRIANGLRFGDVIS
jgi:hypothetical protein